MLAGIGDGDLGFEIKVLLPADRQRAFDEILIVEAWVAALNQTLRAEKGIFFDRFVDREDRGKLAHLDFDELFRGGEGGTRLGGDGDDRVADETRDLLHQQLLVLYDRAEILVP